MNIFKFLSLAILLSITATAQADVIHIDNKKTSELLAEGIPLIDVRTQSEWKQTGIVEGSHLLTFFDEKGNYDLKKWVADLEEIAGKDKPFMLICAVGGRTGNISQFLDQKMGFTQVHNVEKGIVQWLSANKPVTRFQESAAKAETIPKAELK